MSCDPPAICDKCGQPILPGQGRYSIADAFDKEGRWVGGRHGTCHTRGLEDFKAEGERLDREWEKL